MNFSDELLQWHSGIERQLPWKDTDDAYRIWLSEIILQQTRVAQGLPYYLRFVEKYPNIYTFADADISDILKLWEGLGYYSRARNMHVAAKTIVSIYGGVFPHQYSELLKIKGIGKYTAAAIASFAYQEPHAVVDGNVYRVLARFFGIYTAIDNTLGQKIFSELAQSLMPIHKAAEYNQAIMDFGALQCIPKSPECSLCPLMEKCKAFATKQIDILPVKKKKIKKKNRYLYYLYIICGDKILIRQRKSKDIWHLLYELPYLEFLTEIDECRLSKEISEIFMENVSSIHLSITKDIQMLTHQNIYANFSYIKIRTVQKTSFEGIWVDKNELGKYAYPKIVKEFLNKDFYEFLK